MAREIASRSSTRCAVRRLVSKLVMAYHTININLFFSVTTPSASPARFDACVATGILSHKPTYVSVAVHSAIPHMSHNASLVSGAPRLMVLSSRGVPRVMAFQVSWYYT